jgi:pimeloyl-ACP methyl ester carboxylesterase
MNILGLTRMITAGFMIWSSTTTTEVNSFRDLRLQRRRERVQTVDGDFLDLDWHGPNKGPLVILLHGLSGSSSSTYILGLQDAINKLGWRSVALNFRGCSGTPNHKSGPLLGPCQSRSRKSPSTVCTRSRRLCSLRSRNEFLGQSVCRWLWFFSWSSRVIKRL